MQKKAISIAIVGAGISGLTLATRLISNPLFNITLFEKDDRIGGRICTE